MDVSSAAASISAMTLANYQAQASLMVLKKSLDLQAASALQLVQAVPHPPAPNPSATVGGRVDVFV